MSMHSTKPHLSYTQHCTAVGEGSTHITCARIHTYTQWPLAFISYLSLLLSLEKLDLEKCFFTRGSLTLTSLSVISAVTFCHPQWEEVMQSRPRLLTALPRVVRAAVKRWEKKSGPFSMVSALTAAKAWQKRKKKIERKEREWKGLVCLIHAKKKRKQVLIVFLLLILSQSVHVLFVSVYLKCIQRIYLFSFHFFMFITSQQTLQWRNCTIKQKGAGLRSGKTEAWNSSKVSEISMCLQELHVISK